MADVFGDALHALHEGRITFRDFYARTRTEWHRMSVALRRNWTLPPTVTVDDVEQELLLGGWRALGKWRTGRAPLRSFVVWNAHDKAIKWIHQQCGCEQHTRKGSSRFAWCINALTRDDAAGVHMLESVADSGPGDDERIDYETVLAEIPDVATTVAGRAALKRFIAAEGDLERAARQWHADKEARHLFSLTSAEHARQIIRNEIRSVRALLTADDGGASW